ncbi:MAG: glucosaminidase domain-containing protein [Ichthyobacteriaceae bacterium]|nr:glucosaminidase domain-containing protein [Ichthyobacteriaceae bacterium]
MFKNVKNLLVLLLIFVSANSYSQTAANTAYIKRFKKVAMEEMKIYGIPASITLAQGMLESDNGKSRLAKKGNNHFGIKCADWKGKKIYHNDNRRGECFRSYPSAWGSFRDHSKFLKRKRYARLFKLKKTDYKGWAHGLRKAGYATDRKYPSKLIKLIKDNKLYVFDKAVINGKTSELLASTSNIKFTTSQGTYTSNKNTSSKHTNSNTGSNTSNSTNKNKNTTVKTSTTVNTTNTADYSYASPHTIYEHRNDLKYIVVRKGDSYAEIAEEFKVKIYGLIEFNDRNLDTPLVEGDVLYLETKRKKALEEKYKVKNGDSMYSISQKMGIKLEYLYKRNRIQFGKQPRVGSILLLRRYR